MLTLFGASALTFMMLTYALELCAGVRARLRAVECLRLPRRHLPFGVVEVIWALIALRRYFALAATCCLFSKHPTGDVDAVISTLNLKPAPGSSSPTAAALERYRVGLHAVADLARSSGRRAAAGSGSLAELSRTVVA